MKKIVLFLFFVSFTSCSASYPNKKKPTLSIDIPQAFRTFDHSSPTSTTTTTHYRSPQASHCREILPLPSAGSLSSTPVTTPVAQHTAIVEQADNPFEELSRAILSINAPQTSRRRKILPLTTPAAQDAPIAEQADNSFEESRAALFVGQHTALLQQAEQDECERKEKTMRQEKGWKWLEDRKEEWKKREDFLEKLNNYPISSYRFLDTSILHTTCRHMISLLKVNDVINNETSPYSDDLEESSSDDESTEPSNTTTDDNNEVAFEENHSESPVSLSDSNRRLYQTAHLFNGIAGIAGSEPNNANKRYIAQKAASEIRTVENYMTTLSKKNLRQRTPEWTENLSTLSTYKHNIIEGTSALLGNRHIPKINAIPEGKNKTLLADALQLKDSRLMRLFLRVGAADYLNQIVPGSFVDPGSFEKNPFITFLNAHEYLKKIVPGSAKAKNNVLIKAITTITLFSSAKTYDYKDLNFIYQS